MEEPIPAAKPTQQPQDSGLKETLDIADAEIAGSEPASGDPPVTVGIPHRIGHFVILRAIGQGGMGIVYSAYDEHLDRKVAVKLLHQYGAQPQEHRARILREAQAMARLSHPNVVHVYEVGSLSGQLFIAMEFVEGASLATLQSAGTLSWEEILRVYLASGQGLLAAHQAGLVHRDFKPDNVLVDNNGRPRVADFGLAHFDNHELPPEPPPKAPSKPSDKPPLSFDKLVGTPVYMPPEQYRGEHTDGRSDQFSFCAALYEALYGVLPFDGERLGELSDNILNGRIKPAPAGTQIPAFIEKALRKGMSPDPADRFPSMQELLLALDIDPERDPAAAPRTRRAFIVVMLLTALVRSLYVISKNSSPTRINDMLGGAVFILVVALVVAAVMRKALQRNSFHRDMAIAFIVISVQIILMRVAALSVGLRVPQLVPVDLVGLSGLFAFIAWQYVPVLWVVPPYCWVAATLVVLYPQRVGWFVELGYPFMMVLLFWAWSQAAKRMAAPVRNTVERANTSFNSLRPVVVPRTQRGL